MLFRLPSHRGFRVSSRERRLIHLNTREAEDALDEAAGGQSAASGFDRVENRVKDIHRDLMKQMKNVGFFERMFKGEKKTIDNRVDAALDREAEAEIKRNSDAYVSWLGGFVKWKKYERFVALKKELREQRRRDLQQYMDSREQQIGKLRAAASIASRLENNKGFIAISKSDTAVLRGALQRKAAREAAAPVKRETLQSWREAISIEDQLYAQLLQYGVVDSSQIDLLLDDNAKGGSSLLRALQRTSFLDDPDDQGSLERPEIKNLCLVMAKRLSSEQFRGYRAYRLTQPDLNALPLKQRIKQFAESERLAGRLVQVQIPGLGPVKMQAERRSSTYPDALILKGLGGNFYVLDSVAGRLTWKDGTSGKVKHFALDERSFSVLRS